MYLRILEVKVNKAAGVAVEHFYIIKTIITYPKASPH